ncbi:Hypothetical predicted protein [Octopus vulgaris]|uniref:Uncharacterized protein n=1 Tax=Octopus vulgaris TaxID=6645 RepID=A0AA36B598_OCTVU|nr:Hypothetical predicted protein [Octopus vulgaris]
MKSLRQNIRTIHVSSVTMRKSKVLCGEPADEPRISGTVIKTTLLGKLPSVPQAADEPLMTFRITIEGEMPQDPTVCDVRKRI